MSTRVQTKQSRAAKAEVLFRRADQQQDAGNLRSAFGLLLAAAKLGDIGAQLNLGYAYDTGNLGIGRNRESAMFWYKKAYRSGCASGANNIGTIYRDEQRYPQAIGWFERAVALGDVGANLEIAKIYLKDAQNVEKAVKCLEKVKAGKPVVEVSEDGREKAKRLLRQLRLKAQRKTNHG